MEINETVISDCKNIKEFKTVEGTDEQNKKYSKAIAKGARLKLYPKGFRIFRKSKGIVPPTVIKCINAEAMKDSGKTCNIINYRHYNKKRNGGGVLDSKEKQ